MKDGERNGEYREGGDSVDDIGFSSRLCHHFLPSLQTIRSGGFQLVPALGLVTRRERS